MSEKTFRPGQQSDPVQFLSWFLNTLHRELGGSKKADSSIVYKTFQGELLIRTERMVDDVIYADEKAPETYATSQVNLAAVSSSASSSASSSSASDADVAMGDAGSALLPRPSTEALAAAAATAPAAASSVDDDDVDKVAAAAEAAAEAALSAASAAGKRRVLRVQKKKVVDELHQPFLYALGSGE